MQSLVRFSSCRGVAFEVKPRGDPFATTAVIARDHEPEGGSKRFWLPWNLGNSSQVFHSGLIKRSTSRPSSHYGDLELNDDEEEEQDVSLKRLEEGNEEVKKEEEPAASAPSAIYKHEQQPPKAANKNKQSRLSIMLLDQGLFTVYKRFFMVCLALNIIALALAATGHFPYARNHAALFSIANIFVAVLSRNELFWWVVFWLAVKVLGRSWVPLPIKTTVTSFLQSPGGIHSSCGISSIAWLIYELGLILKNRENTPPEILGVAFAILSLLGLTSLAAFPLVRHLHHNVFERTHRFAGWSALGLLWAFLILSYSYDPNTKSYNTDHLGSRLIKHQEFWFTVAITVLIILPWLTVRRVPVKVSAPSRHASLLTFEGGVRPGVLGRISPSPLSQWHAFGIYSDGKAEHSMIVGAVGDYTKSIITKPPSHLWVRKVHFIGLPYLVNMYDRILLVATGSAIGVYLSYLMQPSRASWCLLWVGKEIEKNFGKEIKEIVSQHPTDKVIVHDTAVLGRPNVSQMSVEMAKKWGAEVVFVTSNPEGSRDVIRACKAVGIPAFAPIWDS